MKIDAEIQISYSAEMRNSCTAMGNYYAEDDWSITVVADTIDELENKCIEELLEHHGNFCMSSIDISEKKFIVFSDQNNIYKIPFETFVEWDSNQERIFFNKITQSQKYIDGIKEIKKINEELLLKKQEKEKSIREKKEHQEYLKLKEKYENK